MAKINDQQLEEVCKSLFTLMISCNSEELGDELLQQLHDDELPTRCRNNDQPMQGANH